LPNSIRATCAGQRSAGAQMCAIDPDDAGLKIIAG
jgi:hypothetical protein